MKTKNKYGVYVILVGMIMLLTALKMKYANTDNKEAAKIPVPTITEPTPTVTRLGGTNFETDYPVWQKLPYQGDSFMADRYISPKTLVVKTSEKDRSVVEKEVNEWLEGLGVSPESHKIVWENSN